MNKPRVNHFTPAARHTRHRQNNQPALVDVTLILERPQAHEVFVSGDFNHWSSTSLRMIQRPENGRWEKRLRLAAGRYQYKFIVDGRWIHDPAAHENVNNLHGSLNSVLEVSQ